MADGRVSEYVRETCIEDMWIGWASLYIIGGITNLVRNFVSYPVYL